MGGDQLQTHRLFMQPTCGPHSPPAAAGESSQPSTARCWLHDQRQLHHVATSDCQYIMCLHEARCFTDQQVIRDLLLIHTPKKCGTAGWALPSAHNTPGALPGTACHSTHAQNLPINGAPKLLHLALHMAMHSCSTSTSCQS